MGVTVVDPSQLPDDPFALDADKGTIIFTTGKKGDGKSVFNRRLWRAWPYDALAIDVNGDIDPGPDTERLHDLPTRFPVDHPLAGERKYRKLVYRPDPASPSYEDDIDRAIGVALRPSDNKTLLWLGEFGEISKGRRTRGNCRKALMQSRHFGPLSMLEDCPRPCDVDPLGYLQADGVAEYLLPRVADREKMAELMGFDTLEEHDELWRDNRQRHGPHSFLFSHSASGIVLACPAVPFD